MFQEAYKKAYDSKVPDRNLLLKIKEMQEAQTVHRGKGKSVRKVTGAVLYPVAAVLAVALLLGAVSTPVLAREFPFVYRIVEKYAPSMAEYVLPQELSSTSAGIRMQVEAIQVEEKKAEVLVSFTDEPGFDYIHGEVDLYDSYRLVCYSGESNVGGCSFLEYDEAEDKAYFKLDLSSWDTFDKEKCRFQVGMLLTNCVEEVQVVDLAELDRAPTWKMVSLNGAGGTKNGVIEKYLGKSEEEFWRSGARVMQGTYDETNADKLEITAIGYADGILRVQNCRGAFSQADRHMGLILVDADGNERVSDYSVDWQEELAGENVSFNEQWFVVSEEELEQLQLVENRFITDGCIEGDWEVIFSLP